MFEAQLESAAVAELLSTPRQVARMLAFEAALAQSQGELGLIPTAAAQAIAAVCADEAFQRSVRLDDARLAGNPAIPLVRELTHRVRAASPSAAAWVHYGATSQDVIDTATMLAMRDVFRLLAPDVTRAQTNLAELARRHAATAMVARTLLQNAAPITFGYKVVQWLAGLDDAARAIARADRELALQLGGPVGTLVDFGEHAQQLTERVAQRLDLRCPAISWHTNRVRIADCGAALATLAGVLGKIAHDAALLMQTEIGEVQEGAAPGKGGSSSLPHKRNPVDALAAVAAAQVAPHLAAALFSSMVHEHERAAGAWHAEWLALPQLCSIAHRALQSTVQLIEGLEVNPQRMQANLEATFGLVYAGSLTTALAATVGRDRAHAAVESWCRSALVEHRNLREIASKQVAELGVTLAPERWDEIFGTRREIDAAEARTLDYLARRSGPQTDLK
jgi:3-carboxy-cis,cis-muconate cycloisomerase